MWISKGRSGYGDSTIGGDYDSWDGISPNGKQYKNEATMETRDLSGADYWHLRKQNRPTEAIPESLHMLNKNRANIDAYADPVVVRKTTKVPLKQRILPQATRLEKLRSEILELETAYRAGEFSLNDYSLLRDIAFAKLQRAEVLYKKAISTKPIKTQDETDEVEAETAYSSCDVHYTNTPTAPSHWLDDFIAELPEKNCFKNFLKIALHVTRKAVEFSQATKRYIKTLSEV